MIDIQKNVNPHFKDVWLSQVPYNVLKGGRNSFKSSVIALKLVYDLIPYLVRKDKANVVVIRKVANTIRDSVFNKVQWALNLCGLGNRFVARVSPFRISDKVTGSSFYFYGQDDFQKLKSNDISNIISVWYEEAAEFNSVEEFDQTNITFMRQKHSDIPFVKFYWSYNPPRNPYNWINEWVEEVRNDENYLVHESSYLNDELGFVTEQMLADINRIKDNDYDYYRYLYLGEAVGLGTNVYNIDLFNLVDDIEERLVYLYFAMDSGHQQSATTCIAFALSNRGNIYVLDNYYYSPAGKSDKKAPNDLTKEVNVFILGIMKKYPNLIVRKRTIDSAEGALRNQYYKDYGIRWNPVAKQRKVVMAGYVQSLLAQGRIYVLKTQNNMTYFYDEHKRYLWDEKTIMSDNPAVVKTDDHTCDAFQYGILDNLQDFNLKV